MRYIRNISDDQNKAGDTDNTFRFNLLQDEDIFNFGDYPISINIANSSGYILSMVPEKEFGNSVVKLDFNDQSLKSLTPDDYLLEVEVKLPDGTTATFPTKGGMTFSVNSNLKNTAGKLVPSVTFDEVLNAVDKKVNNYLATVAKGDKGDKGDTGVVDTSKDYTWTGNNAFTQLIDGYTKTIETPTNDINLIKKPGKYRLQTSYLNVPVGMPNSSIMFVEDNIEHTVIYQTILTRDVDGSYNSDVDMFIRMFIDTNWTPWRKLAQEQQVVHNTGTETIAGDKTFTGNEIFTKLIDGYIKTKVSPSTDVNLILAPGKYEVLNTYTNIPSGIPTAGVMYVENNIETGIQYQLLQVRRNTTAGSDMYFRAGRLGVWQPWVKVAHDDEVVHNTGTETVAGDKTFTGKNTFTGQTSFWFKQIQWTSGIMQGTWYIQRIGNWVNAKFDMSANTGTGTTALSLPVGYRPISQFPRELEQGAAGINKDGSLYISTAYTGSNAMTFSYPTNDVWPTA